MPALTDALLSIVQMPAGVPTGTLAIGVHSAGTLGKLTAEAIEGIDDGPVEAARAVIARAPLLRPVTPWGKPTKGARTRNKNKASSKLIIRSRHAKKKGR